MKTASIDIGPPPDGYEILDIPETDDLKPEDIKFKAPDGKVLTLPEMIAQGLMPGDDEEED